MIAQGIVKRLFFLIGLIVLWLAGLLALVGGLWRQRIDFAGPFVTGMLVIWVVFVCWIATLGDAKHKTPCWKRAAWKFSYWIPVLLLGLLLPPTELLIYVAALAGFACIRHFSPPFHALKPDKSSFSTGKRLEKTPSEMPWDGRTTQLLRRFQPSDGKECLEASVFVEFAEGQRVASVHVPFCPVFQAIPRIETHIDPNTDVAAVTDITPQPFGVRVEVRRTLDGSLDTHARFRLAIRAET